MGTSLVVLSDLRNLEEEIFDGGVEVADELGLADGGVGRGGAEIWGEGKERRRVFHGYNLMIFLLGMENAV
jgi:hypothetical protein